MPRNKPHPWKDQPVTVDPPPPEPTPTEPVTATLRWPAPTLTSPLVINVSNSTPYWLPTIPADRDFRIVGTEPLTHGFGVVGGRHGHLMGIEIAAPSKATQPDPEYRVGIKLRSQTGIVHVEGCLITNASDALNIKIQNSTSVVQIQNSRFECSATDAEIFHNDVVQTWAGPGLLRIDNFTGKATFQGLMLSPNQEYAGKVAVELSRINIDHTIANPQSYCYMRTKNGTPTGTDYPCTGVELYGTSPLGKVEFNGWADFITNGAVTVGTPAGGDFVDAVNVGFGYTPL
jgi:hypothetical protein